MKSKKKKTDLRKLIKLSIVIITVLIISFFFPKSETIDVEVRVGDVWTSRDLIAKFSFPVLKYPDEYAKELKDAELSVLPIFERNDTIQIFTLRLFNDYLNKFENDIRLLKEGKISLQNFANTYSIKIDSIQLNNLIQNFKENDLGEIKVVANELIDLIYSTGYLNLLKSEIDRDSIFIRVGKEEKKYNKNLFLDKNDLEVVIGSSLEKIEQKKELSRFLLKKFVFDFLQPNLIYNEKDTQLLRDEIKNKISKNVGIVLENERIVAKHQKITEDIKRKIDSYRKAKFERGEKFDFFLQFIGKILHISIVILILIIYVYLFRKKIYSDTNKIMILSIILILISFFAFISLKVEVDLPVEYLIFVPVASMLVTIIFDSRLGFYVTVVTSLIIGGIRGNDYTIATANIVAGALAVYSVRDIKNRSQIFRSLLFILLGYLASILAFGFERYSSFTVMSNEAIFALANSIISPVLTYGILIFFERIFNVTTDLTLVELADFNNPLLQELRIKAPGTFHHSVNISIMAESAAKAIGANTILTKVGALYHDIGKIVEPNYFIENIRDEKSEHEELDPEQSAQIILNHVEEGIELAKKYNLPDEIINFIPEHHGTTQVQYFLTIAKKLGRKVDEDMFRYPGPKPKSKETAIVMLADAVESMSRNLEVVNETILDELIEDVIRKRFEEGQLNDSNLTLKDLTLIKQSFIQTLLGIYHQRIEYPES